MTVYYCQMCGEPLDTTKKDGDAWYCCACHCWSADRSRLTTGQNIKAAIDRQGLPEGLRLRAHDFGIIVQSPDEPGIHGPGIAWLMLDDQDHAGPTVHVQSDHPRAVECATLLLNAYQEVQP